MKNNVVRALALLIILASCGVASAQKIYLFAEGDYRDPKIGECDRIDVNGVRMAFEIAAPPGKLVVYNDGGSWSGPDFENSSDLKRDIVRAINNCPASGSDAIVFYWSGHGAFDEGGHFLQFSMDKALRRDDIRDALKRKNVRLVVLITDSCNVYKSFPGSSQTPTSPPGAAPGAGFPPLFRSLFFDCSGVVDINSSSPNQYSACREPYGGFFTNRFVSALIKESDRRLSWASVLNKIDSEVYKTAGINQIVYRWSLPKSGGSSGGGSGESRGGTWSAPQYHPENGDRIIEVGVVNSEAIRITSDKQFRSYIANANQNDVILTLIDSRTGNRYYLKTTLLPKGSSIRLGIDTQDTPQQGGLVTGCLQKYPGAKCRYLQNGDVAPVSSYR